MSEPYILFIASWYPNKIDPTLGIFIRRHAESVALFRHVKVVYLSPSEEFDVTTSLSDNIEEIRISYKPSMPYLSAFMAFRKGINQVLSKGYPEIIHAHVIQPAGFFAMWLSFKLKVPFIITEHWTGYLGNNPAYRGKLRKWLTERVVKRAKYISPVSRDLESAMKAHGLEGNYKVIPNVAHPVFFNEPYRQKKRMFIHISSLDERQKNVTGLLRSFRKLQQELPDITLVMAGDGPDRGKAEAFARKLNLSNVSFHGNLEAGELARMLSESLAMVLFSEFENLPCVIIESFACGTPVLTTNVGGISEIVDEQNGILINPQDEPALTDAMKQLLTSAGFNREQIRRQAFEKFSYEAAGKEYIQLYESTGI